MATHTTRPAPVLRLSTIVTRPTIAIDGTHYELLAADEMPWLEFRQHADVFRESSVLLTRMDQNPTKQEVARLEQILPGLVSLLVVDLPKPVLKRLKPEQLLQIVSTFSSVLLATNPRLAAQIQANADRSSTKTASPSARGSRGTTRPPTRGSGSRRSRSAASVPPAG